MGISNQKPSTIIRAIDRFNQFDALKQPLFSVFRFKNGFKRIQKQSNILAQFFFNSKIFIRHFPMQNNRSYDFNAAILSRNQIVN